MAIILTYGKANNNTSTLTVTGLTISVGFSVGVIAFITGSADATGHGSCVDSSGSNTYTQRGTTFFRAGFGWTSECFTAANVGASATSVTWTPPTIGTNFGMSAAVWVLNPNTGIITYADVKQADVTSTVTTTNGVATANIATTTANSLIVAMGRDLYRALGGEDRGCFLGAYHVTGHARTGRAPCSPSKILRARGSLRKPAARQSRRHQSLGL